MREYIAMRALLEEVRQELGVIFEHGISQGGVQEKALRHIGEELSKNGLARGAKLSESLAAQMIASKLDSTWKPDQAVIYFSALWLYTGSCLRRLEFLEAKAILTTHKSNDS